MFDKSSDPAALIRAGRTAFRPEAADRERVLRSLTRTLGDGALLEGSHRAGVTKSFAPAHVAVRPWVLGGLGALAVGGVVFVAAYPWTTRPSQAALPVAPSSPTAESAPSTPLPPSSSPDDQTTQAPRAEGPASTQRPVVRSSVAPPAADSLQEEVRLLSRAEQQLNSGHADETLKTLGDHERRFPDGALAEERMAARVQALCALGRLAAARADLAKFAQAYPRSPHLDRARRACVLDGH